MSKAPTDLQEAIQANDYKKVVNLIKGGYSIAETYEECKTPLLLACEFGNLKIVKYLLRNGSTLTEVCDEGAGPLHFAVFYDHMELTKYLLKKGADITSKTLKNENTVMLEARCLEMILYLQTKGASLYDKNKFGHTLLTRIAYCCNIETIEYLLENGCSINDKTDNGDGVVHTSAIGGNNILLNWLVKEKKMSINEPSHYGAPIIRAARAGKIETVQLLLDFGANIEEEDFEGETPLLAAIVSKKLEMVRFLLEKGASLNVKDQSGASPIVVATKYESLDIIKHLLSIGCSAKETDDRKSTCLIIAIVQGNLEITKYFLENNLSSMDEVDMYGYTPMLSAFGERSNLELINYLLEQGGSLHDVTNDNRTAFFLAAEEGAITVLEWLSNRKEIDIFHKTTRGGSAFYSAAECDKFEAVRWLINNFSFNIHEEENNFTALLNCACRGQVQMVETLIDLGADIRDNTAGYYGIHVATYGHHIPMIEWFLNHGFNVDEPGRGHGKTPLCIANTIATIDYLVERGATVTLPNKTSVIHELARLGKFDEIKHLVEVIGADINAIDQFSYCALFIAAEKGHLDIVKYLINRGAFFDGIEYCGKNFLHICCVADSVPLMEYIFFDDLFENKFYVTDTDTDGKTPLLVAASNNNWNVIEFLLDNGSTIDECDNKNNDIKHFLNEENIERLQLKIRNKKVKYAKK